VSHLAEAGRGRRVAWRSPLDQHGLLTPVNTKGGVDPESAHRPWDGVGVRSDCTPPSPAFQNRARSLACVRSGVFNSAAVSSAIFVCV
jgi:hypothetical protein